MEIGKVSETILKRSVIRQISHTRPEVLLGAGVGEDCAALALEADELFVLSTDPITGTIRDIGELAIVITTNDLASSGATPIGVMLTIMLPPATQEEELREIMEQAEAVCRRMDIQVLGGHTEVTAAVTQPVVSVTGVGKAKRGALVTTRGARPGMEIVITKWVGLEGTSIIAKEREAELLARFPGSVVRTAQEFDRYLSVAPEAAIAVDCGVGAMHDVTEGGIFGALWEMAEASGVGLEVDLRRIPIRQETIEICEFYHINPYQLISSGSMLMAAKDGGELVRRLEQAGIAATAVGRITAGNDRLLLNEGERRFLEPPKTDELYRV